MGELRFDPGALSEVAKSDTDRILAKINWLWESRTFIVHHPLRHVLRSLYKRVIGKYRIVYSYKQNTDEMTIHLVGTRDTIYQDAVKKLHR